MTPQEQLLDLADHLTEHPEAWGKIGDDGDCIGRLLFLRYGARGNGPTAAGLRAYLNGCEDNWWHDPDFVGTRWGQIITYNDHWYTTLDDVIVTLRGAATLGAAA